MADSAFVILLDGIIGGLSKRQRARFNDDIVKLRDHLNSAQPRPSFWDDEDKAKAVRKKMRDAWSARRPQLRVSYRSGTEIDFTTTDREVVAKRLGIKSSTLSHHLRKESTRHYTVQDDIVTVEKILPKG